MVQSNELFYINNPVRKNNQLTKILLMHQPYTTCQDGIKIIAELL